MATHIALQLRGAKPDVTFLFASRDHADGFEEIAEGLQIETKSLHILGCTGESIAAGGQELEEGPALSLWSAVLPGAKLEVTGACPIQRCAERDRRCTTPLRSDS